MKKRTFIKIIIITMLFCVCMFLCAGCSMEDVDTKKLRDLEYTVVPEEEIPEEIFEKITKEYESFCRSAYICSDKLYIVVCYGAQPTEGYSIEVNKLYESSNAIIVETTLIGPPRQKEISHNISYPYIVLKLEKNEKTVVFN